MNLSPDLDLRLPQKPGPLSPVVYLGPGACARIDRNIPISPVVVQSTNEIIFNEWPSSLEWKQVFEFFPFAHEIDFAHYYVKLEKLLNLSKEQKKSILEGAGFAAGREKEIVQMDGFKEPFANLRIQKKIPVKLITLMRLNDPSESLKIASYFNNSEIKPNIVRQILSIWVDFEDDNKKQFAKKLTEITKITKDSQKLGKEIYNMAWVLRYPNYESYMEQIREIIAEIDENIHIEFDQFLESTYFTISGKVYTRERFIKFADALHKNKNREAIERLCSLILR
ncbi:MAG: hypothetical protein ABUK01_12445 [Leptospirales bacterium]